MLGIGLSADIRELVAVRSGIRRVSLSTDGKRVGCDEARFCQAKVHPVDAMMLLATLAYALYSTLLKYWQMEIPALQLLYLQILVAIVVLLPLFYLSEKTGLNSANVPLVLFACVLI